MQNLAQMKCIPCRGREPLATGAEIAEYLALIPEWRIVERDGIRRLERVFRFKDFAAALEFTAAVGALAEAEGHHPEILTRWGSVAVTWWTHILKGLHRNDFIMAAKTDAEYRKKHP